MTTPSIQVLDDNHHGEAILDILETVWAIEDDWIDGEDNANMIEQHLLAFKEQVLSEASSPYLTQQQHRQKGGKTMAKAPAKKPAKSSGKVGKKPMPCRISSTERGPGRDPRQSGQNLQEGSMIDQPTEPSFLKDVATHQMIVIRDDGVHRHIRFKRPDSSNYYFDLITWPGCLCYTGDMGTYVFRRLEDMFEFFRTDREHSHLKNGLTLAINLGYWSEKLIAVDGGRSKGSATEFSEDKFRRVVQETRLEWIRDHYHQTTKEQRRELWEAIDDEVLTHSDEGEHEAGRAAHDFSHRTGDRRFEFTDFWDHDFTNFTYHFVWCCYALAWGIQQYDSAKERMAA